MTQTQPVTLSGRPMHPAVARMLRNFDNSDGHLPPFLAGISHQCATLAAEMVDQLPTDDPETTWGLRMLLLAKDAFVRAAVEQQKRMSGATP
jgi:hypothetical protein